MVASVAGYEDMEDGASVAGYDVMKADQIRRTCWAWQKSESKKRGRNRTMTLGELKDGTNGLIALALAEKSKGKTKTCWMLLIPGLENVDPKRSRDVLNKKTKNDWQEKLRKEDGEKFPEDMSIRSFRGDTSTTSAREDMSTNSGTSSVRSSRRAESSTRHRDDDNPKPSSRSKSTARKPSPVSSHPSSSRHHHSSSRTIRGDMHESSFRDDDDSTRHGSSNSPDSKSYQKKKSSKTFNYNDDHSAVNSARTRTSSRDKSSQRSRATSSNKKPHQDSHKKRSGGHSSSHRSDHSTVTSVNTNTSRKYHSNHGNNDWGSAFTVLEEHDEDFSELSIPKTDAKPTKQESPLRTKEQILKMAIPNPSLNKLASADIKFFRDLVQEVSSAKVHGANKSLCREYVTTCCVYNDETAGTARKAIIQKEEEADKHNEGIQISKDKVEEKKQEVDEKKARIEQAKATAQTKHSELDENLTRKISEIHAKKEEEQRRVNDEYATKEAAAIGKCASRKQVIDTNLKEKTSSIGAEVKQGEKDHVKLEKEVSTDIKRKAETVDAAQKHINVVDSGAASILSFQKEWAPEGEEQGKMNANTKQSLLNGMYAHQALMVAHNRKEEGVEAEKGVDPNVQAKEA